MRAKRRMDTSNFWDLAAPWCQCSWLPEKTYHWNGVLCVKWDGNYHNLTCCSWWCYFELRQIQKLMSIAHRTCM